MTARHTPGRRDVYKAVTAALTGVAAFGSLAGAGYAAGAIAHQQDEKKQQPPETTPAVSPAPVAPVAKRRPHRTVVRTEVVHRVSTNVATVSSGGTISSSAPSGSGNGSSGSSSSGSSSGGGGHTAPRPPAQAPAPAPKPAPAPSSGS